MISGFAARTIFIGAKDSIQNLQLLQQQILPQYTYIRNNYNFS